MITKDKIRELRELLAKGTPGPLVTKLAALHNAAPALLITAEETIRLRDALRDIDAEIYGELLPYEPDRVETIRTMKKLNHEELKRVRELVKVVSKELHEFVNNAHGNEDPCHCGMCDRARAALALASKEVAS